MEIHKVRAYTLLEDGDEVKFKEWILAVPSRLNALDEDQRTPLHWTCALRKAAPLAHWLLTDERTRDQLRCDTTDDGGWTPLMSAAAVGDLALVSALLKTKAASQLAAQNSSGNTALHYAAGKKHVDVCRALLEAADPAASAADPAGSPPALASTGGRALMEVRNRYGESALHRAAAAGCPETVRLLAPLVSDTQPLSAHCYRGNNTVLHLAAQAGGHGGLESVRYLLGLDPQLALVTNTEKQRAADVSASKGICKLIESYEEKLQQEPKSSGTVSEEGDAPQYI